jgi:hypothetical protein
MNMIGDEERRPFWTLESENFGTQAVPFHHSRMRIVASSKLPVRNRPHPPPTHPIFLTESKISLSGLKLTK